jgi:hypothetical protein
MVQYLRFKSSHFSTCQLKLHHNLQVWVTGMSDDLQKASEVFTLVQSSEIDPSMDR